MTAYGTEFFSMNDVNRLRIFQNVIDRRLTILFAANRLENSDRHCRRLLERYRELHTRRDAAHQLDITERQTQRLMNRFRESGVAGLANLDVDAPVITGFLRQ